MRFFLVCGLALGFACSGAARASSSGAPICHVDQIIGCPMGFPVPSGAGIYALQIVPAAYTPGQPITISVLPGNTFSLLNGILLYVERPDQLGGDGYPLKVGDFSVPPAGVQLACAFNPTTQALTHDGGGNLALPIGFTWTAPVGLDVPLRVRAMLVRAGSEYNWDNAPFEVFSIDLPRSPLLFTDSFE
ncbi:MAG: hypothetical protein IPG63_05075 [Xanthomonadales bacterium]|jgi:hypothetical protein|nr:hypothetical protein [Xanthomonadales bacterium]MCC6561985.1 hypothetical protein [Xanthomonadales bacterium]